MPKIILHHYPESPFAEKIRLLLGFKQAGYGAVTVPAIMPKPGLVPLTGGYRRTPVLQCGADVYCDTALIARVLDDLFPDESIFPAHSEAAVAAMARWTDSVFFRAAIGIAFQPRALAENPRFQAPAALDAFLRDRRAFAGGGSLAMPLETALPLFHNHLRKLDRQLARSAFLFGSVPTEADFATYHCCWCVHRQPVLADSFDGYDNLLQWLSVMRAFGHGDPVELGAAQALDSAAAVSPRVAEGRTLAAFDGLRPGQRVEVLPTDYGVDPVRGVLMQSTVDHLSLLREDERVGTVAVHFPRVGFQVRAVADSTDDGAAPAPALPGRRSSSVRDGDC